MPVIGLGRDAGDLCQFRVGRHWLVSPGATCQPLETPVLEPGQDVHVGRPTLTPVSFILVSRERAMVRKPLEIKKGGILSSDRAT